MGELLRRTLRKARITQVLDTQLDYKMLALVVNITGAGSVEHRDLRNFPF